MDNSFIDNKKMIKKKNREATIKHYILGYILECTIKNDVNVIVAIRRLLVCDLKIIKVETFIECLRKARENRLLGKSAKRNYKTLMKMIELIEYEKEEQIEIIVKLQEFARSYKNGIFINSKMGESSFSDVKR